MIRTLFKETVFRHSVGLAFLSAIGLALLTPLAVNASSIQATLPGATSALNTPTVFNLIAIVLIELGTLFWVAGQLWMNFVLQPSAEKHPEEQPLNLQIEQRFERRFSLPTLVLLLIANLGLLLSRAFTPDGNSLSFSLVSNEITGGRFGTYWLVYTGTILLALIIGIYTILSKKRPSAVSNTLPLVNLFLGAILFLAITMSGDASAVNPVLAPYSVVIDWVHLVASSLWVGGMFYILLIYLPVLRALPLAERTRSLLTVLPQFSPLAIIGVGILATTGPLDTSFHLSSANQFLTTAYGRALSVKVLLTCILLATGAYHFFYLRPRLKKEYAKYNYITGRMEKAQQGSEANQIEDAESEVASQAGETKQIGKQVKLREGRLAKETNQLTRILGWEPWLGIAIIVCVGLMNVFPPSLAAASTSPATPPTISSGFSKTLPTSDGKYTVLFNVNPNHFGNNTFTVDVKNTSTGTFLGTSQVNVTIFITMLDMDMGETSAVLKPDGKEGFSTTQELPMGGHWGIEIQLRTPDNQTHEADLTIVTTF
jgi:copper transport protein